MSLSIRRKKNLEKQVGVTREEFEYCPLEFSRFYPISNSEPMELQFVL